MAGQGEAVLVPIRIDYDALAQSLKRGEDATTRSAGRMAGAFTQTNRALSLVGRTAAASGNETLLAFTKVADIAQDTAAAVAISGKAMGLALGAVGVVLTIGIALWDKWTSGARQAADETKKLKEEADAAATRMVEASGSLLKGLEERIAVAKAATAFEKERVKIELSEAGPVAKLLALDKVREALTAERADKQRQAAIAVAAENKKRTEALQEELFARKNNLEFLKGANTAEQAALQIELHRLDVWKELSGAIDQSVKAMEEAERAEHAAASARRREEPFGPSTSGGARSRVIEAFNAIGAAERAQALLKSAVAEFGNLMNLTPQAVANLSAKLGIDVSGKTPSTPGGVLELASLRGFRTGGGKTDMQSRQTKAAEETARNTTILARALGGGIGAG